MLGVNLVFAGFALSLNGLSYFMEVDNKVKGVLNVLVGIVIGINAVFQVVQATDYVTFGFAAATWLFSLNYFLIAAHIFVKSSNWKVFGLYSGFAAIMSLIFMVDTTIHSGPWEMIFMWAMWAILWGQGFFAIVFENKLIDKLTPHVLILNGLISTFVPGISILLGIIL